MRTETGALLAVIAALMLLAAPAAAGKCVENPDGLDDLTLGPCQTCSADGTKCAVCWNSFGLTPAGECVQCNVTGTFGKYCDVCEGEDPSFCLTCGGNDEEPLDFALYATAEGKCKKSPVKHCAVAESLTGACTTCNTQFGLVEGDCVACKDQDRCLICDGDASKCSECYGGYVPDPKTRQCTTCPKDCERCSTADTCDHCSWGFALNKEQTGCVACPAGCDACSAPDTCNTCEKGYTLVDGVCKPCDAKYCTLCEGGPSACTICDTFPADGSGPWGLDTQTGACTLCSIKNCDSCQTDSTACDWCADGYSYNSDTKNCDEDPSSSN
ncbi:serine threonine isoform B [Micractinium conductrix]|uniref:Serine threonine isoform B n=1 Tax=Micractinium conductrix TaxID=554055 RepID=A0A2P6V4G6_9CHLO|nr:serine threonine isoform B [Micractinium conductrix]|eukprot:PSC68959.1 serine threonine isoform B [Micractinium conductrix]